MGGGSVLLPAVLYVDMVRKSFSSNFPKVVFYILVSVKIFAAAGWRCALIIDVGEATLYQKLRAKIYS